MNQMAIQNGVKWIAPAKRSMDENFHIETAYFKQIFILAEPEIVSASIKISANSRYCLYVNGLEIVNGPCKGNEWYQYCDVVDILPYLQAGENVIAVKVVAFHAQANRNSNSDNIGPMSIVAASYGPMLIVDGAVTKQNGGGIELSTGKTDWFCKIDDAITWKPEVFAFWAGNTEVAEGSKLPYAWNKNKAIEEGFTKAVTKWSNEISYGEINSLHLYERPIPFLIREKIEPPEEMPGTGNLSFIKDGEGGVEKAICKANETYTVILEMKQLTTSYVYIKCEGGKGSKITIGYSEGFVKRNADGAIAKGRRRDISGKFNGVSDVYYPGGQKETYSPFWFRTFRFIRLEITTGGEELIVYPLELTETRYPLQNKVTAASKNNVWVKPVWDMSLRTLQLCMHETYEDCPFYEQLQYAMDTRLQILFTYAVSSDTCMAKRTIHDFHTSMLPEGISQSRYPTNYRQVIPVFSLHWVLMLTDYYEETGDIRFVRQYRFTMERIFYWFNQRKGELGLVEKLGYWEFADWTNEWNTGIPTAVRYGPSTINNLFYAYVLKKSLPLFEVMGMPELGAMYENEARGITEIVRKHCWNNEKQMLKEGPEVEEYSQHAQLWAVLCGMFRENEAERLMEKTIEDESLIQCSFVMQFYLFRALEEAGLYEKTEKLWELWKTLPGLDLTTVPEIPGGKTRSDCHAWGALMLYEWTRKALGVTPLKPGYEQIEIRPRAYYFRDAEGEAPTPFGQAKVSWAIDGAQFHIQAETPVPAKIVLPDGSIRFVEKGKYKFSGAI